MLICCTMEDDHGWWGLCASEQGIVGVWWPTDSPQQARRRWPREAVEGDTMSLAAARRQLREYLAGCRQRFQVPVDLGSVTPFQRRVLMACAQIPYGQCVSYGELACRLGLPRAARAVGQALARNPVPIFIPCHRVVGRDGRLVGFGGGMRLKAFLLQHEGIAIGEGKIVS